MPRKREYDAVKREKREIDRKRLLDKIRHWDPCLWYLHYGCSKTASEAWRSPCRFVGVEGGNRTGKTTLGMAVCSAYARGIHPLRSWCGPNRGLISIATRGQSATEWGPRMIGGYDGIYPSESAGSRLYNREDAEMACRPFIPPAEIRGVDVVSSPNGRSISHIQLLNGSEIWIALGDDPNSWKPIESTSFDWILVDEAIGDATIAGTLFMRLGDAIQKDLDGERPGGGWMLRTFTEFVANMEIGQFRNRCANPAEQDFRLFRLSPDDNPACGAGARRVLSRTMSKKEADKRVWGTRSASDDTRIFGAQFDPRRHLLGSPYPIDDSDMLILGVDPGWTNPFGVTVHALNAAHPEWIYNIAYFSATQTHGKDLLLAVRDWLGGRGVAYMIYDPAANQTQKTTGTPLIDSITEWCRDIGLVIEKDFLSGHNRHEPTIKQVQEYLDPSPWDKTVPPRMYFDQSGPGMDLALDEFVNYHRDPKTGLVYKHDDTFPDCIRYVVTQHPVWERPMGAISARRPRSAFDVYRRSGPKGLDPEQEKYYKHMMTFIQGDDDDGDGELAGDLYGGVFNLVNE